MSRKDAEISDAEYQEAIEEIYQTMLDLKSWKMSEKDGSSQAAFDRYSKDLKDHMKRRYK